MLIDETGGETVNPYNFAKAATKKKKYKNPDSKIGS